MLAKTRMGEHRAIGRIQRGASLLEMTLSMTLGAVILVSLFSLYYVAAATAAKEESRSVATSEGRLLTMRVVRDVRLMGLLATEDIDGDSNDIDTDVPDINWSNGVLEPIEHASTYNLVFSCDIDDDSVTETVGYWMNENGIQQDMWEWQRDSTDWSIRTARIIGDNVDAVLFRYYDRDGNELPTSGPIPVGGYTLTAGERMRVTAVEVSVVIRSEEAANVTRSNYLMLPDGRYWYDHFHRELYRFLVRGRNLNLES